MGKLLESISGKGIDRRAFLALSAGTAALAGLGLTSCASQAPKGESKAAEPEEKMGEWRTAICWHNCGGRCLNRCYVVDDAVLYQKTDDTHEDSPDYPQQRACARGHSNRYQVFSPDRIKYPLKRKSWQPGGGENSHGDMRGIDEWERISWDEAIGYIADEVTRINDAYGPSALFVVGSEAQRVFTLLGGYSYDWGSTSFGTWAGSGPLFGAFTARKDLNINNQERLDLNDRFELRKSELVVWWAGNPAWSGAGNPTYYYLAAKRAGAKFIFVDPYYNNTMQALDAEWIPIRPGTDHTMLLALMYTLLDEDDPDANPLIDWDFLKRCTLGFTSDNMPEGADPSDNFQDYILGVSDGTPKTPEWAEPICGVSADKMKELARLIGTTKKVSLQTGYASARTNNSDSFPQAFQTLGWMCGHVGESGRMTGTSCRYTAGNGGPELVVNGSAGVPAIENKEAVKTKINRNELWNAILTGKYTAGKDDVRDCNIKLIYHAGSSTLNQVVDAKKGIEAHRKVDMVVSQHYSFNTSARYSDIILPVTTRWERYGDFGDGNYRKKETIFYGRQIVAPLYEAQDDYWIAEKLASKLGLDGKLVNPLTIEQRMFNTISTIKVIKEDGSDYEKLVSVTEDDIKKLGVEGETQEGRMGIQEFIEAGVYQVKRYEGDPYSYVAHKEYREDPEGHPQDTASGKFEIYCTGVRDLVSKCGWTEVDPYPSYNPPQEGYEETFSDWANGVKGEYPLQFYTIHYPRRGHSNFDNVPWLRELFPQEAIMNASDAAERGIKENDVILVKSMHGETLRHVHVTERMMPGVVTLGEGAWLEIDESSGVDLSGNVNMINGGVPTGQGHVGFNTCICEVAKSALSLDPDYTWPSRLTLEY